MLNRTIGTLFTWHRSHIKSSFFRQMVYLLSNPKIVYKNFTYRKKTKAQFARDDPAFLVLLAGWLVVSSWVYDICSVKLKILHMLKHVTSNQLFVYILGLDSQSYWVLESYRSSNFFFMWYLWTVLVLEYVLQQFCGLSVTKCY